MAANKPSGTAGNLATPTQSGHLANSNHAGPRVLPDQRGSSWVGTGAEHYPYPWPKTFLLKGGGEGHVEGEFSGGTEAVMVFIAQWLCLWFSSTQSGPGQEEANWALQNQSPPLLPQT